MTADLRDRLSGAAASFAERSGGCQAKMRRLVVGEVLRLAYAALRKKTTIRAMADLFAEEAAREAVRYAYEELSKTERNDPLRALQISAKKICTARRGPL